MDLLLFIKFAETKLEKIEFKFCKDVTSKFVLSISIRI
jgi:hypothetical protein